MTTKPVWPDENGLRSCSFCKEKYPANLDNFYENSKSPTGLSSRCRECTKLLKRQSTARIKEHDPEAWTVRNTSYHKTWKNKDPERSRRQEKHSTLWKMFRITLEQYEAMLIAQAGVCAVCKLPPGNVMLSVDHDHKCCPFRKSCGRCVRGLLCFSCNTGLGGLEGYLDEAKEYLEKWN